MQGRMTGQILSDLTLYLSRNFLQSGVSHKKRKYLFTTQLTELYLNTQFIPRSKHTTFPLQRPVVTVHSKNDFHLFRKSYWNPQMWAVDKTFLF